MQPFLNLYHHHPLSGGALRAGFYLSFLTPYNGDDFVGFTSPPPTPDGLSDKRRGSRCLMCVGSGSREKQPAYELGWGLFASSLSCPFLRPICSLWRPLHGPPLAGTPLNSPSPVQGSNQPSSTTSSPILLPTPGLWSAVGHRRHPIHLYQGLFQAPTPSLHTGLGVSSTPRPPST